MRKGRKGLHPFRNHRGYFAAFALKYLVALALLAQFFAASAQAACTGVVAEDGTRLWRAAAGEKAATLTYLGHASFLIESPDGVRIVTDYNGTIQVSSTVGNGTTVRVRLPMRLPKSAAIQDASVVTAGAAAV